MSSTSAHADPDARALGRVRDRVGDEVADRLAEHLRVAAHVQSARRRRATISHTRRLGLDRVRVDRRRDDLVDRHVAVLGELVGGLQPREVHDARGEHGEPGRLGIEPRREVAHLVGVVGGGLDGLGEQADGADRGLQLVTRVGDEVAAHLLDALALGDVAQHEERQARRDAGRAHRDEARLGGRSAAAQAQRRRTAADRSRAPGARAPRSSSEGSTTPLAEAERTRGRRGGEDGGGGVDDDGRVVHPVQHFAHALGDRDRRLGAQRDRAPAARRR